MKAAIQQRAAAYRALDSDALEQEVIGLLGRHEQYMDRECLSTLENKLFDTSVKVW